MRNRKKLFVSLVTLLFCLSCLNISAFATENPETSLIPSSTRSTALINEGGLLANGTKNYQVSIPYKSTYTVTCVAKQVSGSGGLWFMMQNSKGGSIIDTVITGSYQKRFVLPAGTYYITVVSAPGTCSYSFMIHETFA